MIIDETGFCGQKLNGSERINGEGTAETGESDAEE
jgi:hypothetical protein